MKIMQIGYKLRKNESILEEGTSKKFSTQLNFLLECHDTHSHEIYYTFEDVIYVFIMNNPQQHGLSHLHRSVYLRIQSELLDRSQMLVACSRSCILFSCSPNDLNKILILFYMCFSLRLNFLLLLLLALKIS